MGSPAWIVPAKSDASLAKKENMAEIKNLSVRRRLPGMTAKKEEKRVPQDHPKAGLSCFLMLRKEHAEALVHLLEDLRANDPRRFDTSPLGEVLVSLKSGGRIG